MQVQWCISCLCVSVIDSKCCGASESPWIRIKVFPGSFPNWITHSAPPEHNPDEQNGHGSTSITGSWHGGEGHAANAAHLGERGQCLWRCTSLSLNLINFRYDDNLMTTTTTNTRHHLTQFHVWLRWASLLIYETVCRTKKKRETRTLYEFKGIEFKCPLGEHKSAFKQSRLKSKRIKLQQDCCDASALRGTCTFHWPPNCSEIVERHAS